jgi:phage tail sheath protein FI
MPALPYPGVSITETDRSSVPTRVTTGVPAGIVGTAASGPAYIPLVFNTYASFTSLFGISGGRFGPIAVSAWLNGTLNSNAAYIRVLGAGDGQKRSTATGAVNRAGFIVGEEQVKSSGIVGQNPYATSGGVSGRTYFLGCFMSESAGSSVFSSAGIQNSKSAIPIIRGVVMTPSGVTLTLSGNSNATNQPTTTAAEGSSVSGSVTFADGTFVMLLNGHVNTVSSPNVITASLNFNSGGSYFPNVLNKDPNRFQETGHYLYAWYDIQDFEAVITGSDILASPTSTGDANKQDAVFITSSSIGRNASSATTPNFEQFRERFTHPVSPFVVSQDFGGTKYDLFRVHAVSDGITTDDSLSPDLSKNYKITISDLSPAQAPQEYGTFALSVRPVNDPDDGAGEIQNALYYRQTLSFDPNSTNYIASVIGDQNIYFDFDRNNGSQKIVVEGDYPVTNNYVRIELSDDFLAGNIPAAAIPAGFRGHGYLFTSGSSLATFASTNAAINAGYDDVIRRAVTPPIPYRNNIKTTGAGTTTSDYYTWGTKVEIGSDLVDENKTPSTLSSVINGSFNSLIKFFPSYDLTGKHFFVDDSTADTFQNSLFTIENIRVTTGALGDTSPETINWASASYVRQGGITTNDSNKTRALTITDLTDVTNRNNVSFTFMMQGGFDGVNIFDSEKVNLTDLAATREINDPANQGGVNGPTVAAYKKAIDVMGSTADVNIQLLAVPGIRTPAVTNYAISAVENRFDAMYIMDIQQKTGLNTYVTSSDQDVSSFYTVADFKSRGLNSSFAAAYFPDIFVQNPDLTATGGSDGPPSYAVPASVGALSAYARNDAYAPWYAPAGTTRGVISTAVDGGIEGENSPDLGSIYDADINPIVKLSTGGTVVWGQKTLLRAASSLDRVNVRRLLIDVRRRVRAVANSLLFEPNTQTTLDRFNALVNPIMQDVQSRSGITRYKVVIDTSTTTQADIDNNTIRGKIFLQPVRTAEFISIDFTVNATSST